MCEHMNMMCSEVKCTSHISYSFLFQLTAISKTMRGRPPLQTLVLKHSGRTLSNHETVSSILSDIDSDSDSDDEDTIGEDDYAKLKLTLDILPPIDPKFGTEFKEKTDKMSTKELLGAYCLNVVGMRYGLELGEGEMEEYARVLDQNNDNGDGDNIIEQEGRETERLNQSLHIRKQAALLQKQMEKSFGDEVLQLMDEEHARVQAFLADDRVESSALSEVIYGLVPEMARTQQLRKNAVKGGAAMNIKRVLQRNMNVVRLGFGSFFRPHDRTICCRHVLILLGRCQLLKDVTTHPLTFVQHPF